MMTLVPLGCLAAAVLMSIFSSGGFVGLAWVIACLVIATWIVATLFRE